MKNKITKKQLRERLVAFVAAEKHRTEKKDKATKYAAAKAEAKAHRPPALDRNVRIRARTELQLLLCDRTGIIPEKTCLRLGIMADDAIDTESLRRLQQSIRAQHKALTERNAAALAAWRKHLAEVNAPKLEIKPL